MAFSLWRASNKGGVGKIGSFQSLSVNISKTVALDRMACAVFYVSANTVLYGRRFLQVKRPNQQYQSTEGRSTQDKANNENN